ncbi:MAG: 3-dehydroquinate synthase II family protein [Desulfovibrio sp.]|jgi:3-dehydroquinate synthase II|nr:3-dehydroquinate synthase II family protein [Desulfovibrio sp.]
MKPILFKAVPFVKKDVTRALEAGVDGLIVPAEHLAAASSLARCIVLDAGSVEEAELLSKEDEEKAAACLDRGQTVLLRNNRLIIPVENLLAHGQAAGKKGLLAVEVLSPEDAAVAAGILEKGADTLVVPGTGLDMLREIIAAIRQTDGVLPLEEAVVTEIRNAGMGHRVCVDTLSVFSRGQGMLTGNSAAFTFLVNAETESNEYVASRPFRINAGAVHAYALAPGDATAYLQELRAGSEVLTVDHAGNTGRAVVGRVKVERRPMLYVGAGVGDRAGGIFLQNAETIRLVRPGGQTVSVVDLSPGDTVLCRLDDAGRHFGMRIKEDIREE